MKYAVRTLTRRPGFSLLAILTLAIGIGVNTVAFNGVNALLFKPRHVADADSLGWLMPRGGTDGASMSWPDYQHFARGNRTFEGIAAEGRLPFSMRADGRAEQVWSLLVSSNYLSLLRVTPELGRLFTEADLRETEIPALASHRFWIDRLGGGETVAARSIVLNGRSVSIVGVLPDSFQGPGGLYEPDIWLPLERMDALNIRPELRKEGHGWLTLIGRLRVGATRGQAQGDLDSLAAQLATIRPVTHADRKVTFTPMIGGHPDVRGLAPFVWIAMGVVGIVLLIACFNVAGLLLARASERQAEIAVRTAMGAGRLRILRQLVTEGVVIAVVSGLLSLIVASWSADLLSAFSLPAPVPQRLHFGIDARLVTFTALMVLVAGVLPALLPALRATRTELLRSIRSQSDAGHGRSRARSLFVVAQVAGSTMFLAAALLFVRSYWNSATYHPGFDTEHTLLLELTPSTFGYDQPRARTLVENLLERVRALPGVQHAAIADRAPFYVGFTRTTDIQADRSECATPECRKAAAYSVSDEHFAALGVALKSGRDFTAADVKVGASVIISDTLASRLWPGEQAVGRWLREGPDGRQVQVIGVASDVKHRSMQEAPGSYLYRTLRPDDFATVTVIVRTHDDPRLMAGAVQDQLAALDPGLPARVPQTMAQRMEMPLWPARTAAGFLLICGLLALLLATVGLFGVTYYAVSQRTREFGIRVALGATPGDVIRLVLFEGLALTIPGVGLGIIAALIVGRLASHILFGVSGSDPLTFILTASLQAFVALAACAVPAQRATRADPMIALRAL